MNSEVLLLGVIVGGVNYLFRYLPLRLRVGHARPARRGPVSVLLDTIGIASICALLVVSSVPEILADAHRPAPTLTGFLGAGGRLLENPQHHCPDPAVGVCLWSGMENHQRALSFTYQFWSIIHLIYLSQ